MKDTVNMFMPTHSRSCAKRLRNAWDRSERPQCEFECAGQICGAVFIRQCERLLCCQPELIRLLVVSDIASCGLGTKPLAQIALVCFRLYGKLRRTHGAFGKCFVQPQFFPDDDHAAMNRGMVVIGEKLGLYKALAEGPMSSAQLAAKTKTDERYLREWLASQAAGGYVTYNEQTDKSG